MFFCGIGDEAGLEVQDQVGALLELGWRDLEVRNLPGGNWHDVSEAEFEAAAEVVAHAGIRVVCFASEVANWSCDPFSAEDFDLTRRKLERALARMEKLGTKLLRGMSFKWQLERAADDVEVERQVFAKVGELVRRCEDAGVIYLHENCMNYGGQSWGHTLRLLEKVDSSALQLVFDTGNPVFAPDRGGGEPYLRQDGWNFFRQVRERVRHVHIKDGIWDEGKQEVRFTLPGEGEGHVERIVRELLDSGYEGGLSIEPHLTRIHHIPGETTPTTARETFVTYGQTLEKRVVKNKKIEFKK